VPALDGSGRFAFWFSGSFQESARLPCGSQFCWARAAALSVARRATLSSVPSFCSAYIACLKAVTASRKRPREYLTRPSPKAAAAARRMRRYPRPRGSAAPGSAHQDGLLPTLSFLHQPSPTRIQPAQFTGALNSPEGSLLTSSCALARASKGGSFRCQRLA